MLTHEQVWRGIDRLALRNELSASGLAKRAGLDPTTFNKSKRITKEGKLRWPSTESLSKILDATHTSIGEFVHLVEGTEAGEASTASPRLRFIRLSDLSEAEATDEAGFPRGDVWEEIDFPLMEDAQGYVVELDQDLGTSAYRSGDMVVISPTSGIRRNDRVILRRRNGELVLGVMERRTAHRVSVRTFDSAGRKLDYELADVAWMARIIWVSQ